jgi:hypothetical protein
LSTLIGRIEDPNNDLFSLSQLKFVIISATKPAMGSKQRSIYINYRHTLITEHNVYRVFQLDESGDISLKTVHHYFEAYAWRCWYR